MNFETTCDTLIHLVNSKDFALEMSLFSLNICGLLTTPHSVKIDRKFWKEIPMVSKNGGDDIEFGVVSVEVKFVNCGTIKCVDLLDGNMVFPEERIAL